MSEQPDGSAVLAGCLVMVAGSLLVYLVLSWGSSVARDLSRIADALERAYPPVVIATERKR